MESAMRVKQSFAWTICMSVEIVASYDFVVFRMFTIPTINTRKSAICGASPSGFTRCCTISYEL